MDSKLEDSRTKRTKITHPTLPLERTYCANCGKPWGWASTDSSNLVAPAEIQIICSSCEELKTLESGGAPTGRIEVPRDFLRAYGLFDENDPQVMSTPQVKRVEEVFAAMKKLTCPACGSSDYTLEDNPDNPTGPQVAICSPCSNKGLRKGWLLRERVNLKVSLV